MTVPNMSEKAGLVLSLVISVVMVIYGIIEVLPVPATVAFINLLCVIILLFKSNKIKINFTVAILSSLIIVIVSIISYAYPYVPGTVDRVLWGHIMGMLYWTATYPVSFLILEVLAITKGAKFNFPLLACLPIFLTCSQIAIAWTFASIFCGTQIDTSQFTATELITSIFVSTVLSLIAALIIWKIIKKKHFVLSEKTCVVKE